MTNKNKVTVKPDVGYLPDILSMIYDGELKIPSFQRDYIWDNKQKIELFDSIVLGYPIGALLFWKTKVKFQSKTQFGPYNIQSSKDTNNFYILDGLQRLTTLFGCLMNPNTYSPTPDDDKLKEFSLYYDLENEEFYIPRGENKKITNIPVYAFIDNFAYLEYIQKLNNSDLSKADINRYINKGHEISGKLNRYQMPYINILGGEIKEAVNIFSRINSKGTPISTDWMLSALTHNTETNFDLAKEIKKLLNKLNIYGFDTLKRDIVIQCIQTSYGKIYFDSNTKIEDLAQKSDFIEKTIETIEAIEQAVKFLYEELLVVDKRLLPYNNQLIFTTYYFTQKKSPTKEQKEELKKWFWVTTYSRYFSIYNPSHISYAFDQFRDFLEGKAKDMIYNDNPDLPFQVDSYPEKVYFGSVRSKALLLFLLNHAYDFQSIQSEEVESFQLNYLLNEGKISKNIVPTINFVDNDKNIFKKGNFKDLSFLLEDKNYSEKYEKLFITESMIGLPSDKILEERKSFIKQQEKDFTQKLGLDYGL